MQGISLEQVTDELEKGFSIRQKQNARMDDERNETRKFVIFLATIIHKGYNKGGTDQSIEGSFFKSFN